MLEACGEKSEVMKWQGGNFSFCLFPFTSRAVWVFGMSTYHSGNSIGTNFMDVSAQLLPRAPTAQHFAASCLVFSGSFRGKCRWQEVVVRPPGWREDVVGRDVLG